MELRYRINDISKNHQKNLFRLRVSVSVPDICSSTGEENTFVLFPLSSLYRLLIEPTRLPAAPTASKVLCEAACSAVNVTSKDLEKLKLNKRKRALSGGASLLLPGPARKANTPPLPPTSGASRPPLKSISSSSLSHTVKGQPLSAPVQFKRSKSDNERPLTQPWPLVEASEALGALQREKKPLHLSVGPEVGEPPASEAMPLDMLLQHVFHRILAVSTELQKLKLTSESGQTVTRDMSAPLPAAHQTLSASAKASSSSSSHKAAQAVKDKRKPTMSKAARNQLSSASTKAKQKPITGDSKLKPSQGTGKGQSATSTARSLSKTPKAAAGSTKLSGGSSKGKSKAVASKPRTARDTGRQACKPRGTAEPRPSAVDRDHLLAATMLLGLSVAS